jgi:hypothetical protein
MDFVIALKFKVGGRNKVAFHFIVQIAVFIALPPNIISGTLYSVRLRSFVIGSRPRQFWIADVLVVPKNSNRNFLGKYRFRNDQKK